MPSAAVVSVRDLHEGQGPWLIEVISDCTLHRAVLRTAGTSAKGDEYLQIEAAALTQAERAAVDAPRLIAIDDGRQTGVITSLQTALTGDTVAAQPRNDDRLLAVGGHLAEVHRIAVDPGPALPQRLRPLEPGGGYTAEKRASAENPTRRSRDGTRLLAAAAQQLASLPRSHSIRGLVHGDAWLGNIMAAGTRVTGLIDWGCAGVGHPGIDLGHARLSAAFTYGIKAADAILDGWEQAAGRAADAMPYWDTVAALETAPDMGAGTDTRDEFLQRALAKLH
ncbi:Phosphotransferase enzyme family protein [Microlunatus soli]|uniref:Phosphotransferase enzyme family protein n=2 Tax=Microlunatus soli TaxID=630515 RepID=A0A1H1QBH6_9ACTN|nr:Phosphotransferase enzyme family protein [Microlunatus soli]